jgi:hypothetical protein
MTLYSFPLEAIFCKFPFLALGVELLFVYVYRTFAFPTTTCMEEDTGETHAPGWSTAVADFLDDPYARDDAEKAAAAERRKAAVERRAKSAAQTQTGGDAVEMTLGFVRTSF